MRKSPPWDRNTRGNHILDRARHTVQRTGHLRMRGQFRDNRVEPAANPVDAATACRDGVSWVQAYRGTGAPCFARASRLLDAARRNGVTVIWDLMHFGWPDDVDPFDPLFPGRFGRWAAAEMSCGWTKAAAPLAACCAETSVAAAVRPLLTRSDLSLSTIVALGPRRPSIGSLATSSELTWSNSFLAAAAAES